MAKSLFRTSGEARAEVKVAKQPMPEGDVQSEQRGDWVGSAIRKLKAILRLKPNLLVEEDNFLPRQGADGPTYDAFAEYLPWLGYEDGLFVVEGVKKGKVEALAFAIEVTPQTGATPELASTMSDFATMGAPVGTGITCTMFGSPNIDPFLSHWLGSMKSPDSAKTAADAEMLSTLSEMNHGLARFLQRSTIESLGPGVNARVRTARCVISVVIPTTDPDNEVIREKAFDLREQIAQKLRNFSMFSHHWEPIDLLYWADAVCNPQTMFEHDRPYLEYDESREIRHQVMRSDTRMEVLKDKVIYQTGESGPRIVAKSYSVRSYPGKATLWGMRGLLGSEATNTLNYPCPFMLTAGFILQDFDAAKGVTTAKALRAQQTAESPLAKMLPRAQDTNADYKLALAAFETSKGTVKMFHQLVLFSREGEEDAAMQCARSIFRDKGWEINSDMLHHTLGLLGSYPMTFGPALQWDYGRMRKLGTRTGYNVGNLLPLVASWTGTERIPGKALHYPQFMMVSRLGQPMLIDVFANPSGNYNGAIVGKSGSGKSVTCNQLVNRTLAMGGRCWVIDVGGSYEKLCEILGGQYIRFEEGSNISLNPFSMVAPSSTIDEDLEVIAPVLEMMATGGEWKLDGYLRNILETAIKDIWYTIESYSVDPREVMTITMVAEMLKANCAKGAASPYVQAQINNMIKGFLQARGYAVPPLEDPEVYRATYDPEACDIRVREMGVALARYGQEGVYGRWFEKPATITFNSPFVVLELEELNQKPALRAVVLMLLMNSITGAMYQGDRSQRMVCLIDEAWDLLSAQGSGPFIEAGYRRARKYGGAFWTATQDVGDYDKSDTARAAFQNSDWMMLLAQKDTSIQALVRSGKLVMDEHNQDLLKTVHRAGNVYSEVYVKGGDMPAAVGRMFLDPFTAVASSTTAEVVRRLKELKSEGRSMAEAVQAYLDETQAPPPPTTRQRAALH